MRAWKQPVVPSLPGRSGAPRLFDTATGTEITTTPTDAVRLYVCGITPYDATHLGHASTYLAYDTLLRAWRDAGFSVHYAQNITDIDDPLLERASATGVDWQELAESQIELFRTDMETLSIIPPYHFVAVTEVIDDIAEAVCTLFDAGVAYRVSTDDSLPAPDGTPASDVYFDIAAAERVSPWRLGDESNLDRPTMLELFAERGGDPEREGKRDALDPLLWRAARAGEPSWPSRVGPGRPGWHIECSVIALQELGADFTVQGGGCDLIFPHHEMSAGHAAALSGRPLAGVFSHAGMVGYKGEKMSKSVGNLVLVSALTADGADPRAIRLALLSHHYRSAWEWTESHLSDASARLATWSAAFSASAPAGPGDTTAVLQEVREAIANDLDTPSALALVDAAAQTGVTDPALFRSAVDALLGIEL
ncbi:cysteine--1-D-myo-inosityl 2-amino-2-deoxy-alpha-D-glucopyranoside ligase [Glaciibacter superstes]|uniref:cysteine--1-D-myo-inosityl 2-amino-2-deoxy-alpha-D-glucopyranoside ligase n=1 Tax=Glaciibacter superstes TaxID=501023 RepID=UPI0003B557C0|nr:cysteine--1-D-myo-inosityl 2-amino-2-deoxy-alpha-D-glucopyranoside ligase [Glaciibacter superstes]